MRPRSRFRGALYPAVALVLAGGNGPLPTPIGGDIVMIVLDDAGAEWFGKYQAVLYQTGSGPGPSSGLPNTPNIDSLMTKGLIVAECRSSPYCSETRATIHTGRFPFRTGIGQAISHDPGIDDATIRPRDASGADQSLAKVLSTYGYTSACFGRWHMSGGGDVQTVAQTLVSNFGFDRCVAHLFGVAGQNLPPPTEDGICKWSAWDGIPPPGITLRWRSASTPAAPGSYYACDLLKQTTYPAGAALDAWIRNTPGPIFAYVPVSLPGEAPYLPPNSNQACNTPTSCGLDFHTLPPVPDTPPATFAGDGAKQLCHRAELEAVDKMVGEILAALQARYSTPWDQNATVILTSDNGSPEVPEGSVPKASRVNWFWPTSQVKTTLYEGGIRVPLFIAGKAVSGLRNRVETTPVLSTDLFYTVHEIASGAPPAGDGVSLVPLLQQTGSLSRSIVFTESFNDNFNPQDPSSDQRTEWGRVAAMPGTGSVKTYKVKRVGMRAFTPLWAWLDYYYQVKYETAGSQKLIEVGVPYSSVFDPLISYLDTVGTSP